MMMVVVMVMVTSGVEGIQSISLWTNNQERDEADCQSNEPEWINQAP